MTRLHAGPLGSPRLVGGIEHENSVVSAAMVHWQETLDGLMLASRRLICTARLHRGRMPTGPVGSLWRFASNPLSEMLSRGAAEGRPTA